ncbi:RNA polymerase III transcription factor TFIIIC [Pseudoloma neurophilia]|uniref:RNA polymerase III transcription factor TFIIIC n=1 Tax=Pseudoloma neurophilia TaxID=146866 RepID=A0A0R0M1I2_9MICR|nr:RNA polymerase III transcription factor TFIIIC [Pseudoloma neurophilia]
MKEFFKKKSKSKRTPAFFYKGRTGELLTEGNSDYVAGRLDDAIEKFKQVIQLTPTCHQAYYSIGLIYEEKSDFVRAYEFFKLCFNLKRNNQNLLEKLYSYGLELDKKEEALSWLEKIQDPVRLDEKINLAHELGLKDKEDEFLIEKNDTFTDDFILNLSVKNLQKAIFKTLKSFVINFNRNYEKDSRQNDNSGTENQILLEKSDSFIEQEENRVNFYDEILNRLYEGEFYDLLVDIFIKLKVTNLNIRSKLIFAIAKEQAKSCIIGNDLISNLKYNYLFRDLFFKLSEFRPDILEYLITVDDIEVQKDALKRFAEQAIPCQQHNEHHKCNLFYYLEYLKRAPDDNQIRLIVHSIYHEIGDFENAKLYSDLRNTSFPSLESAVQFFKKVKDKTELRFSQKDCYEIQKIYHMCLNMHANFTFLSSEENEMLHNLMSLLLNDFFTNLYIFSTNLPKFQSFFSKKEARKDPNKIILQSLHGLHPFEWFEVVKINFYFGLNSNQPNCLEILYRSLRASIFRENGYFYTLAFMLIKYAVFTNNFIYLNKTVQKLQLINPSIYNLYHFLLNFFIGYYNKNSFRRIYVNLRKFYLRIFEKTGKIGDDFVFLSTFLPCFIFPETLDKIDKIYKEVQLGRKETILLAIIFLNNARSRRISNRNYFVKRGLDLLKSLLPENTEVAVSNDFDGKRANQKTEICSDREKIKEKSVINSESKDKSEIRSELKDQSEYKSLNSESKDKSEYKSLNSESKDKSEYKSLNSKLKDQSEYKTEMDSKLKDQSEYKTEIKSELKDKSEIKSEHKDKTSKIESKSEITNVHYNLARAYQHFGLNGFAELYYRKCFNTEYEHFAKFNLVLIYKKNGSYNLIEQLFLNDKLTS